MTHRRRYRSWRIRTVPSGAHSRTYYRTLYSVNDAAAASTSFDAGDSADATRWAVKRGTAITPALCDPAAICARALLRLFALSLSLFRLHPSRIHVLGVHV
jgi:hypothetical protein